MKKEPLKTLTAEEIEKMFESLGKAIDRARPKIAWFLAYCVHCKGLSKFDRRLKCVSCKNVWSEILKFHKEKK